MAITRHEAIQILDNERNAYIIKGCQLDKAIDMAIDELQTKSTGECLQRWGEVECSRCGEFEKKKSNFCPNCGAKMVERG